MYKDIYVQGICLASVTYNGQKNNLNGKLVKKSIVNP